MNQDIIIQEAARNRVIIIHDNPETRDFYRLIINASARFTIAGTHSSFDGAIPNLNITKPDIIIVDIDVPDMMGIDGIQKMKRLCPSAEIIVITEREDSGSILRALESGATGYISKSSDYLELLGALEEVMRGGAPMSSKIAKILVTGFHKNFDNPLSYRETGILKLISEGKSYTQIAGELKISKDTVRTHNRNIYRKLQVHKKSEAIKAGHAQKII